MNYFFEKKDDDPRKGKLIDKNGKTFFEGKFHEERNNQLPFPKKGTFHITHTTYDAKGKHETKNTFEGEYNTGTKQYSETLKVKTTKQCLKKS